MPHLRGDSPGGVRGSGGGRLLDHETANLGGGRPASVPSGIKAAGPWAGQKGVTVWTLAQGQLPRKVMWVLPLPTAPLPSPPTPPQVLILNLEGVAGCDSGVGARERPSGLGYWQGLRCQFFGPRQFAFSPPRDLEEPLLFIPLALKMFRGENKLFASSGLGEEGDTGGQTGGRAVGEGALKAEIMPLLPGCSQPKEVGEGWGLFNGEGLSKGAASR